MVTKTELKFKQHVGGSSTTAWLNNKRLGHGANAVAYEAADGNIIIKLESNCIPVRGISHISMTAEEYEDWKDRVSPDRQGPDLALMNAGIELFGAVSSWSCRGKM